MKKLILLLIGLFVIGSVSGLTEPFTYDSPYSDTFSLYTETGVTQSSLINYLNIKSCYDEANYNNKACSYAYWCYAILPSNSNNIGDALQKECLDITETDRTLVIKDFVPPVGVLYYVSTFVTVVDYTYNDATSDWNTPTATIPETDGQGHQLINAEDIRSVCPNGQMLGLERDPQGVPIKQKCFNAERICLDVQETGLCTNPYPLYVLDTNGDGYWTDELASQLASNYCADRNKDKICDIVVSFWAVDDCSAYTLNPTNGELYCSSNGPNGIDDAADMAALWSCLDAELSPNPWVCDDIDIEGCLRNYDPVCITAEDKEFPNECFAQGQGYTSSDWTEGKCENPIRQCIVPEDCPTIDVCLGGVSTIQKLCLGEMCSYSGACQNVQCQIDADCEVLNENTPCAGVVATCQNEVCTLSGKCITAPTPTKFSLWDLIMNVWNAFWNFIKSLFN